MILKRRILTYCIIFVTFTLLNATFPFSKMAMAQPPNFKQYINPDLGTSIFYPSDWPYLFNEYKTVFISPQTTNSQMGSAFITVENPVDFSNTDADALFSQVVTYIMQKDNFTVLNSSFGEELGPSAGLLAYSYNDPDFGPAVAVDILMVDGGRISNMRYQADPSTFPLYAPIFGEMISTYEFAPSSIAPPPEVAPETESACFLGEDVTVTSCLSPDASLPPAAAGAITRNMNAHYTFQ